MRAIQIEEWGGPEVLRLVEDATVPMPGEGQVLVRVSRAGINFADTHARENSYLARYELPLVPGSEVAGVVVEDGHGFAAGQRVAALVPNGGYAEYAVANAALTVPIPDGVTDAVALALLLQGLTAWHLYKTCAHLAQGESVVVVAAAGGVGSLATQLARPMGAGRVIGLASSEEKRELVLSLGADVALDPEREDLADALRDANGGRKVDVVLEMAGGPVFDACLQALAPFGRLVAYGIASREQNEPRTGSLMRGSKSVVGFWLAHCFTRPDMVRPPLADLLDRVARGELRVVEGPTYPLSQAARAHEDLQARRTAGKLLLDPSV